tara:strand:+ start:2428 stop:3072 length:645 start_codon:yes stop_codon:yes gene_type:complete
MEEYKFIKEQIDKIIEFKPNVKYSNDYKHPKDRVNDFVSICKNKEQIYDVLKLVKIKIDAEIDIYLEGDLFGVGVSYYENYKAFHRDLMTEVDTVIELFGFNQTKDDLVSVEEVEEKIPELEKLQYRTKLILLQELGFLDLLKKKDVFKNKTKLSKILSEIVTGKNDDINRVYDSIRTDLSYINQKKHKKSPYTKSQISKVNSILASFSLPRIK